MHGNTTLEIKNIHKAYGKKQVLNDISFTAKPGQAIGILGINGSGKSTLLSCIAKSYSNDKSIHIGYVPQENPLFDELKPVDNIRVWTKLSKSQIIERLNEPTFKSLGVCDFLDTPVCKMSGGMKKRVSIASVLINNPNVLLMDEPFSALDLVAKQDILSFMKGFLATGGIIIVASHDEHIFDFCNKVYLLQNGTLTDTASLTANGVKYIDLLKSNRG